MKQLIPLGLLALLVGCSSTAASKQFEAENRFSIQVPSDTTTLHAWLALPDDREPLQEVHDLTWDVEGPPGADYELSQSRDDHGNRYLHLVAREAGGHEFHVSTRFRLLRREANVDVDPAHTRPLNASEQDAHAADLRSGTNDAATAEIRAAAEQAVGQERNPVAQARALYDWVLDHTQYWVKQPDIWKASPVGSSSYCFESCTGNCTDIHSLYVAAARSVGLPTRMVYGSFFKGPLDGQPTDQSYHCWVEFFAPQIGWIPLDVAVADIFIDDFTLNEGNAAKVELTVADGYHGPDPELVDYYFGNLDARRVTWNRGRDLSLGSDAAQQKVNAMPKAHIEADGVPLPANAWSRTLTFREIR